jgi:hypothetical protein
MLPNSITSLHFSAGGEGGVAGARERLQEGLHTAHTGLAPAIESDRGRHLWGVFPLPYGAQCEYSTGVSACAIEAPNLLIERAMLCSCSVLLSFQPHSIP